MQPVIFPAQRAAEIVVKALGHALHVEAMPTQARHPPAAAVRLHADRAGGADFLPLDVPPVHACDFFQEGLEPVQDAKKATVTTILEAVKRDRNETPHLVHQEARNFLAIQLIQENIRTGVIVQFFKQSRTAGIFAINTAKNASQVAQDPLRLCTGHRCVV